MWLLLYGPGLLTYAAWVVQYFAIVRRAVPVLLEFVYWLFLNYGSAPDPSGDRGDKPLMVPWGVGVVCRLLYDVFQMMSLWSLYRCVCQLCHSCLVNLRIMPTIEDTPPKCGASAPAYHSIQCEEG